MNQSTLDPEEIEKFEKMSSQWWNLNGPFKPLHMMNPIRLEFIIDEINNKFANIANNNLDIIDVGCGGGITSEPLSFLNFNVDAIDASEKNINIAKAHQVESKSNVNYICNTVENIIKEEKKYDVILALEIIEHVDNIPFFLECLSKIAKKNSIIIISTINKNMASYINGIIVAEYLLRWVPRGTHNWSKFIKPSVIANLMMLHNFTTSNIKGISYKPLKRNWQLSSNTNINYILSFTND
jgi:2-polyprenyl-6-hydroxyphenyl methylase / 3-demethylubiquinone-9 3-methyltransferase